MMLATVFVVAAFVSAAAAGSDSGTSEAAIKKMKMKQLKKFLSARSVECTGCVEKNDFVKKALSVRSMPVAQSAPPMEISSDPLWEQWATTARTVCESVVTADQKENKYCVALSNAVENLLMRYTKKFMKTLSVDHKSLTKNTLTHPYKTAGELRIRRVAEFMTRKQTKKTAEIEAKLDEPLSHWLRDCAIQNINTMLDTIQGNDEL
eukprot:TRINITY_DN12215_c0_g1_i1.p1 TRINITY_DN12215_c0_g1~~TRINITY_DN12215_c0_g1_i1.p1  ORF type:complete len:207 (+),score=54.71 TRINITY_DN12215_c0_g1_i1:124-744(+)